ncbi:MAG: hypothetical protein QCH99_09965 [Candidatus Bathyarchaeota archaeon]|nr:hypothetical protein [Candidatus Bathyarchaeum tardum]
MSPKLTLRASKNLLMYWLADILESEIPDVDIFGSDRKLLDFAYQDLTICLAAKDDDKKVDIAEILNDETRHQEVKSFLKVWTQQWLHKWRERVTFCQKMPHFSLEHVQLRKNATKNYKAMEHGEELKKMIVQKLINNGEVCMPELIAENMIIEEMTGRMRINKRMAPEDQITMEPYDLFQNVLPQVKKLSERKIPLIRLKLMTDAQV